jgi:hypothetical protein
MTKPFLAFAAIKKAITMPETARIDAPMHRSSNYFGVKMHRTETS